MNPKQTLRSNRVVYLDLNMFPYHEFRNGATINFREIFRRLEQRRAQCAVASVSHCEISPRRFANGNGSTQRIGTFLTGISVSEYLCSLDIEIDLESYALAVRRALADLKPGLLFINTPSGDFADMDVMLVEEVASWGGPVLCFMHDDFFPRPEESDPLLYQRYKQCLAEFRVMCPSLFLANQVTTSGLAERVEHFPNLFTLRDVISPHSGGEAITLINPHPLKGIAILEEVARQMPDLPFLVVQGWPMNDDTYKTSMKNITVLPFHRDIRSIWQRTKILVAPSLCNEAYGRVVVEAMLNGIPVIANRIGGLPEAAGSAGILLDTPKIRGDVQWPVLKRRQLRSLAAQYATAIDELLSNPKLYDERSAAARDVARKTCEQAEQHFEHVMQDFTMYKSPSRKPPRGTMLISPHPDDIALSIGGLLHKKILPAPVQIVTVFGRSNYLAEMGFQRGWKDVTLQRKYEDSIYASHIKVDLNYLEFPEASLRFGPSFEQVFTNEIDFGITVPVDVSLSLRKIIDDFRPLCIFAPLGLGGHHDHLLLQKAISEIAREKRIPTAFYEDLPYAAFYSEEMIQKLVSALGPDMHPIYIPIEDELPEKIEALRLYPSQIQAETIEAVKTHAMRREEIGPVERIWSSSLPIEIFAQV